MNEKVIFLRIIPQICVTVFSIGDLGSLSFIHDKNVGRLPCLEEPIVIIGIIALFAFAVNLRQE